METMSQQAYPEGWWGRVAASLQLSAEQRALLTAAWGKLSADRAALLARHEAMTKQLRDMQQQQAAVQQDFGLRIQKVSARCVISMQKQARQSIQGHPAHSSAAAMGCSISSGSLNNNNSSNASMIHRSTTPVGGCCSSSSMLSTASAAAAAAALYSSSAGTMPGGHTINLCGGELLLLQQQQQPGYIMTPAVAVPAAPHSSATNSKILSMICDVQRPNPVTHPDPSLLWVHPEVLLCPPRPGQVPLQAKLSGLRCSLALLYSWAGLVCYNALSRKQLAVAAVTSYPFAFDPVAGESTRQVQTR
jgi:hypothetical protein